VPEVVVEAVKENTRVLTEPYVLKEPRETVALEMTVLERRTGNVAVVV
jgi:hypothetical protein